MTYTEDKEEPVFFRYGHDIDYAASFMDGLQREIKLSTCRTHCLSGQVKRDETRGLVHFLTNDGSRGFSLTIAQVDALIKLNKETT